MVSIDVASDLHFENDESCILARVSEAGAPHPGRALDAGAPHGWTWAVVPDVEDGWLRLSRVTAREAASRTPLVSS